MNSYIYKNKFNSFVIISIFFGIVILISYILANLYNNKLIIRNAIFFAILYTLVQYFLASKLAILMSGAKKASAKEYPLLYKIIKHLSYNNNLPMPSVYIINDNNPNAFATGRNHKNASIAVTSGLINVMNTKELEGVLAHEISHIKNYDIRLSMIVYGLVVIVGIFSDMLLRLAIFGKRDSENNNNYFSIFSIFLNIIAAMIIPIIATIIQLAISRQREYLADATAVLMTKNTISFINALNKLNIYKCPMIKENASMSHMWISSPMNKETFINNLFSTHPSIESRIQRLKEMDTNE